MRLIEMFHPELERFVDRIFQRLAPILHRYDTCAEAFHQKDIGPLTTNILTAHENNAHETKFRGDRCGRNAVLARARFGNEHFFTEPFRKKPLPKTVSDLVCTGMIRTLIFEAGLGASEFLGGPFCEDERSWSTGIIFEQILKLLLKRRIGFCLLEYIC